MDGYLVIHICVSSVLLQGSSCSLLLVKFTLPYVLYYLLLLYFV